ncbi:MAG: hypothetical protein H7641_01485 [Candidatus Heimdallarchaeota archaeon]|nr:hypothetical protein [Candidatus Heimdallarchaeota archaeon]MCK4876235.1 hypothetical protein [Candidatus Heimdallarchaeota archaeon]
MKSTKVSETKTDFKISWQFFKANYKSFLATELFAFLAFLIVISIMIGILILVFALSPDLVLTDLIPRRSSDRDITFRVWIILPILAYLTMVGFLYCQFGLAYDIFTSGDMFSEFKKSFSYFKEHWWKYILLTFVTGFSFFMPNIIREVNAETSPWLSSDALVITFEILRFLIFFVILVVFSNTLPSVTAQGNLKNGFRESFRIVRKEWKRLIKTWGVYFLLFISPSFILAMVFQFSYPVLTGTAWIPVMQTIAIILLLYKLFIGFPMLALIATRIYNNVDFERIKTLTTSKRETVKKENEK